MAKRPASAKAEKSSPRGQGRPERQPRQEKREEKPRRQPPRHQAVQPGHEGQMTPEPEPKARQYRAAGKLRGRAAIITGGYTGAKTLQHISWEEFFTKFDESDLVFLYQEKTRDGRTSRFRKFVGRRSAQDRESGR